MKTFLFSIAFTALLPAAYLDLNEDESLLPAREEVSDVDELSGEKVDVADSVQDGLVLLSQGEYERARVAFEKGVKEGEAPAYFALGSFFERGYIDKSGKQVYPDLVKAEEYYRGAAEKGHTIAKFNLGILLLSKGKEDAGMELIQEVADAGKVNAINRLGDLYLRGEVIKQDTNAAIQQYKTAQAKGSLQAAMKLGNVYSSSWAGKDLQEAIRWYERAAQDGEMKGYLALSKLYLNGPTRDLEKAAWCMEKAVETGDNTTYYNLGQLKENLESLQVALPYFKRAAEFGHPMAQHKMGDIHARNEPRDMPRALEFYRKAAAQGVPISMYNAASILRVGDGVEKNEPEAARLLIASAQRGYMLAQFDLAMALQRGMGVKKSPTQALQWFNQAAKQGYAPAKFELGKALEKGIGISQNPKEAVQHYLNAARQGLPLACYKMATLCLDGTVIKKDPVKAYAFLLGIKKRNTEVVKLMKTLEADLSEWDKVDARELMVNNYAIFSLPKKVLPTKTPE